MKSTKGYIISFIILLAIAALVYFYKSGWTTFGTDETAFAVDDTSAITKIYLADKTQKSILLERVSSGKWTINGKYTARQDAIILLLKTMKMVQMKSPVPKAAHNNIVRDMAASGVKVEIYEGEKLSKVYYVGGATQDNFGTFMMMGKSKRPFVTHIPGFFGYLSTRYFTEEHDWRDRAIFKYDKDEIASVKVEFSNKPDDSFEITTDTSGAFRMRSLKFNSDILNFDTLALKSYLTLYKGVFCEAFLTFGKEKVDSLTSGVPLFTISVTDIHGKSKTVKGFMKKLKPGEENTVETEFDFDVDRLYALINDDKDLVLIQYFTFDKLLLPLKYFELDPVVKKKQPLVKEQL